jgi:hypothetical protein
MYVTEHTISPLHVCSYSIILLKFSEMKKNKHFPDLGRYKISTFIKSHGPPLWSSGQSSWLQIRRPGFNSRHYQKKKVVGLERDPLSLVNTTEELLDRKVAAPV